MELHSLELTTRRGFVALALAATACTQSSPPEQSIPASIAAATQSGAPTTSVVCEWYSTIDFDPSQIESDDHDFGNPPNEDSPNELIAQAWAAQLALDYGLPTDDSPGPC
jgi:ABC-type transport system substrate-binding protein